MLMREIRGDIENQPNVCGSNIPFLGGQSVINFVCFCGICEAPPVGARNRRRSDARFGWFDDLVSGRAASMVEIGKRESVGKRYVSRMIRLAFLAPAIVERIAEGRQPPELTAQFLSTGRGDLPLSWSAQEKLLGFADLA
jgi:hypothetical protein